MTIIINNINIYHIHDNKFNNNGNNNHLNVDLLNSKDADPSDYTSCTIVNDDLDNDADLSIAQLKERILKSELEVRELLDQINYKNK